MASSITMPRNQDGLGHDEYQILIDVANKFDIVSNMLHNRRGSIRNVQYGIGITGVVATVGAVASFGAAAVVGGAIIVALLFKFADIAKWILDKKELNNLDEEWKKAKNKLLSDMNLKYPLSQEELQAWSRSNLDAPTADVINVLQSKSDSHRPPRSLERIQQLNIKQIELLLASLKNIVLADLDPFELVTGSIQTKRKEADEYVQKLGREIREIAEQGRKERELREEKLQAERELELKEQEERLKVKKKLKEEKLKKERELKNREEKLKKEMELKNREEKLKKEMELKNREEKLKKERELKNREEKLKKEKELKEREETNRDTELKEQKLEFREQAEKLQGEQEVKEKEGQKREMNPQKTTKHKHQECENSDRISDESDESISSNGTCPVFSQEWQGTFTLHSTESSTIQLPNSDVLLTVPPGAVPIDRAHVQAAVCTDIEYIRNTLRLEDTEEVVSPLVEYKTIESFRFQKPVVITLPHFLPEKYDSDSIYVYHVVLNDDHTIEKRRVSATSSTDLLKEGSAARDQYPRVMLVSSDRITIETKSFSAHFLCRCCKIGTSVAPDLYAAVSGKFANERDVNIQIKIWDRRLNIKDFRKKVFINPRQDEIHSLMLLEDIEDTQLHIGIRTGQDETLKLDKDGQEFTPRKRVFNLTGNLVCGECLRKGEFKVLEKKWILGTTQAVPHSVCVSIDVEHRSGSQDTELIEKTTIPCMVTVGDNGDNVASVIMQKLKQMDWAQRARVAGEMRLSAEQLDDLIRSDDCRSLDLPRLLHVMLSTIPNNISAARGAEALEPEPRLPESHSPPSKPLPVPINCEQDVTSSAPRQDIRRHRQTSGPNPHDSQSSVEEEEAAPPIHQIENLKF